MLDILPTINNDFKMFDSITKNFGGIIDKLRGRKFISRDDFEVALREIRIAMLEADVSLPIIKEFIKRIKDKVIGEEVIQKVSAGQMIVKIINDELLYLLGNDTCEVNLQVAKPMFIMMCGLQGAGKTTATAKLAKRLKDKHLKKVLLVSLDVYRPAAKTQLEMLAPKVIVDSLEIKEDDKPIDIATRAMNFIKDKDYDVVIFDTAGRLAIDESLMKELEELVEFVKPHEKLLVTDSLMGQDAVNIANEFNGRVGLTGIILTRIDGGGRAGCALTMKIATGCPIKYMSSGEKLEQFDEFIPERIASKILDMGDIISFVEKAQEVVNEEEATKLEAKIKTGTFDFDDFLSQLRSLKKLGGLGTMLGFLPGAGKIKEFMQQKGFDDNLLKRQESIVYSMTKLERKNPEVLNSSRKFRIAKGSGSNIQEVNSLLKKFKQIKKTIEVVGSMDKNQLKDVMSQL
ncbi:MAG: signal recognition particle protein [Rickettsiales bacterium]|nr:signal recognition particle protein [Rickettsiales bacterium]